MPGTTGSRARRPGNCVSCGKPIPNGTFNRTKQGDYHPACYIRELCKTEETGATQRA